MARVVASRCAFLLDVNQGLRRSVFGCIVSKQLVSPQGIKELSFEVEDPVPPTTPWEEDDVGKFLLNDDERPLHFLTPHSKPKPIIVSPLRKKSLLPHFYDVDILESVLPPEPSHSPATQSAVLQGKASRVADARTQSKLQPHCENAYKTTSHIEKLGREANQECKKLDGNDKHKSSQELSRKHKKARRLLEKVRGKQNKEQNNMKQRPLELVKPSRKGKPRKSSLFTHSSQSHLTSISKWHMCTHIFFAYMCRHSIGHILCEIRDAQKSSELQIPRVLFH